MLTDITLGQYFPGNSLLHRMDARVKIVLLFFYIVGIFLFDNNWCYLMNTMFALVLVGVSRISPRVVLKAIKPLWWILLLTFIIQLFSVPGEVLMKIWIFDLTYEGLEKGFFISLRYSHSQNMQPITDTAVRVRALTPNQMTAHTRAGSMAMMTSSIMERVVSLLRI